MSEEERVPSAVFDTETPSTFPMSDEASRKRILEKYLQKSPGVLRDLLEKICRSPLVGGLILILVATVLANVIISALLPETGFFSDLSFKGIFDSLNLVLQWGMSLTMTLGLFLMWNTANSHRGELTPGLQLIRIVLCINRIMVGLLLIVIGAMGFLSVIGQRFGAILVFLLLTAVLAVVIWLFWKFYSLLIAFVDALVLGLSPNGSNQFPNPKGLSDWVKAFGIIHLVLAILALIVGNLDLPENFLESYSIAAGSEYAWIPRILSSLSYFLGAALIGKYADLITVKRESAFLQRMK